MATNIITTLLIIIMIFASCKKSATGLGNPAQNKKYLIHVEEFTQYDTFGNFAGKGKDTYTYDKATNTIRIDITDTFPTYISSYTTTHTYSKNTITIKNSNSTSQTIYYLNPVDSIPDSAALLNGNAKDIVFYSNHYGADNKISTQGTSSKQFSNGVLTDSVPFSTITYTWQDGNLTNESGNGFKYSYTYYSNQLAASPDDMYFIINPFYKVIGSKNILESRNYDFTVASFFTHFDYTYDTEGRVVNSTQTDKHGHITVVTASTYY